MPVIVKIPAPLRPLARGRDQIAVAGSSAREVLESLEKECAGLGSRILDERGELRRFVNLFLNEEDVRHLQGLDTPVEDGDVLSILPAIAGGAAKGLEGDVPEGVKGIPS
jgi:molybdopterin synthase sulfur carrier subunit